MLIAVAHFAAQARILSQLIARLALVVLRFEHLTAGLVLKLVILAQERQAEAALEDAATVRPDISLALNAHGILEGTRTSVRLQAFSSVANPRLAKVTNSADHTEAGDKGAGMLDDTIAALCHALYLAALCANWKLLHLLAKVAKCSRFLLALALVTLHICVAWCFGDVSLAVSDLFLSELLLFGLLPLARLLLRHAFTKWGLRNKFQLKFMFS